MPQARPSIELLGYDAFCAHVARELGVPVEHLEAAPRCGELLDWIQRYRFVVALGSLGAAIEDDWAWAEVSLRDIYRAYVLAAAVPPRIWRGR